MAADTHTTDEAFASATAIAADVRAGRRKAADITQAALARIEQLNPASGAVLEITRDHALSAARRVDERVAQGDAALPLAGVPVALKDNLCTRFGHTTCASKILAGFQAPYDATVVARIEAAGGVVVAKTNLDEFAMGSSNENSSVRPVRNPWDPSRVPGGSSGGSAVAVASGMTPLALGSDTGGSIRQPAALCGVVGMKPTYGRVSRYGLVAFGSSLDQIGPFARSIEDAALLLSVIAGSDAQDSTCAAQALPDYVGCLGDDALRECLRGLRIGVPQEYFGAGVDDEVRSAVRQALRVYEKLGARLVDVSLPRAKHSISVYYLVATAEASSNLARFDGVHYGHRTAKPQGIFDLYSSSRSEGFGPEVKRRIMLGTFALSSGYVDAYYLRALKVRRLVQQDYERAFEQCDVIAGPTTPTPAFRLGEKTGDPLQMYLADIFTIAANLAGVPALSLPCGFSAAGLPIGLQLSAPLFGEVRLLQTARLYERETHWGERHPA